MTIYLSHASKFDYKNNLYKPIRQSELNTQHIFVLPHETSSEEYDSRGLFKSGQCNLVLADASFPSSGQKIELEWALEEQIPIVCIYKTGSQVSDDLKKFTAVFLEYKNTQDMIFQINNIIQEYESKN